MAAWRIIEGDCIAAMREMEAASVDSIVCDPPYGLGFMGRAWDALPPGREWAEECLRVLKPGGHLLAFGGTRTYHRLAVAVEDAGFEVRDMIAWLYGSGFPKSLDVSKAIDKAAGAEREVVGERLQRAAIPNGGAAMNFSAGETEQITAPATPEAEQWDGWGTALKPAHEPIVVARKPLIGTVAANVLEHGTGAISVDGCRIGMSEEDSEKWAKGRAAWADRDDRAAEGRKVADVYGTYGPTPRVDAPDGRWPANVVLDPEAAGMLDAQTGDLPAGVAVNRNREPGTMSSWMGTRASQTGDDVGYGDSGGASRFFYVAKASRAERNAGLDGFEAVERRTMDGGAFVKGEHGEKDARGSVAQNVHPTVKPIELMRWLLRLVTPPGGTVLDPFLGSGTTGCAAALEGFRFIGIERQGPKWVALHPDNDDYVAIAHARIAWWAAHPEGQEIVAALEAEAARQKVAATGQLGMEF